MGNIRIFSIWWFLFIFFIKWQRWCKVLCLINCNHEKNFFSIFLMEKLYYTLKRTTISRNWGSINIYWGSINIIGAQLTLSPWSSHISAYSYSLPPSSFFKFLGSGVIYGSLVVRYILHNHISLFSPFENINILYWFIFLVFLLKTEHGHKAI